MALYLIIGLCIGIPIGTIIGWLFAGICQSTANAEKLDIEVSKRNTPFCYGHYYKKIDKCRTCPFREGCFTESITEEL